MLASIFSLNVIQTALELGCIYALVALALFLSYSILNIADLSTDGCFTLGCAVACQVALTGHPFLALLAAMRPQTTRFTGGAFLRRKESDRLHTVAAVLAALGVAVEELPDGLTVVGGRPLHGGVTLDAFDDHRIAMLCGCAALFCREPVVLRGGDCVAKSYEDFWRDYAMLGGKTEELMES